MKSLKIAFVVVVAAAGMAFGEAPKTTLLQNKLTQIRVPKIVLVDATVEDAVEFLRKKSQSLDPEGVGVNIVLKIPGVNEPAAGAPRSGTSKATASPLTVISAHRLSKLEELWIPKVDLRNVTVEEAIEFLRQRTQALDTEGVGVNFVLKLPLTKVPASGAPAAKPEAELIPAGAPKGR